MLQAGILGLDESSQVKDDSALDEFTRWFPEVTRRHDDRGNLQHAKCVRCYGYYQQMDERKISQMGNVYQFH